jgi:hypothetical protein
MNLTLGTLTIVVAYLIASASCWTLAEKFNPSVNSRERHGWRVMAIFLFFLSIIKLLDLQTSMTEAFRAVAFSEGWYKNRQPVQKLAIAFLALSFIVAGIVLLIWSRNTSLTSSLGFAGGAFVLMFVLIRAVSFHPVDRFINTRTMLGASWNWILEMSAVMLILLMSQLRRSRGTIS